MSIKQTDQDTKKDKLARVRIVTVRVDATTYKQLRKLSAEMGVENARVVAEALSVLATQLGVAS